MQPSIAYKFYPAAARIANHGPNQKMDTYFDPTHTGGDTLPAGRVFRWKEVALSFTSDTRKLFNYMVTTR